MEDMIDLDVYYEVISTPERIVQVSSRSPFSSLQESHNKTTATPRVPLIVILRSGSILYMALLSSLGLQRFAQNPNFDEFD
jgi:hypothetical protein